MKYNVFTYKNNSLLCWRLGSINPQKQKHYNRDVKSIAGEGTHKPPIPRGFWAFPYPHYDYFFCYHQWLKYLPKKYRDKDYEKSDSEWLEYERLLKEIKKKFKPSLFYAHEFYSHIFPNGRIDYQDWFYWNNVRDWGKIAQKTLFCYVMSNDTIFKLNYSNDHLEIFIP